MTGEGRTTSWDEEHRHTTEQLRAALGLCSCGCGTPLEDEERLTKEVPDA